MSDQTVEAAHQFVDRVMNQSCYVVKEITWKEHGNKLLQGEFNKFSTVFCFMREQIYVFYLIFTENLPHILYLK